MRIGRPTVVAAISAAALSLGLISAAAAGAATAAPAAVTHISATTGVSADAVTLRPAGPDLTNFYMVDGNSLGLQDPGEGNQFTVVVSYDTTYTFVSTEAETGINTYQMHVNGGTDCVWADASSGPVKDTACSSTDTFEDWEFDWGSNPTVINYGADGFLTAASTSSGALVKLSGSECGCARQSWHQAT